MSYSIYYELEVTKLGNISKPTLILDEVINQGEAGTITKAAMLNQLKLIKQGVANHQISAKEVIEDLRNSYEGAQYALTESGRSYGNFTWDDHRENMKEFSKKYPMLVFTLSGKGESAGDLWREYYYNGKYQSAPVHISYPAFDIDLLQS